MAPWEDGAMSRYRQVYGHWGEELAARYLLERGFQVLGRNVRTGYGELDLVCRQAGTWVFVEVKTRKNAAFGLPETGITARKRQHLIHSAMDYLQSQSVGDADWRIDVIAIMGYPGEEEPDIVYFENAVGSDA